MIFKGLFNCDQTFRAGQRKEIDVRLSTTYPDECIYEVTSGEDVAEFIDNEIYIKSHGRFEITVTSKFGVSDSKEFVVTDTVSVSPKDDISVMFCYSIYNFSNVINFTFDDEFAVTDKVEEVFENSEMAEMRYENGQYVIYAFYEGSTYVTFKNMGYTSSRYYIRFVQML